MEEPVWIFFSVIGLFLAIGIMMNLSSENKEDTGKAHVAGALEMLKGQCDYVCDTGPGTNLPVEVTFPSSMVFYTNGQKLCSHYAGRRTCSLCNCELDTYQLDLNTSFARESFDFHTYTCYFSKKTEGIAVECQG